MNKIECLQESIASCPTIDLHRHFSRIWQNGNDFLELLFYIRHMHSDLLGIKKFYSADFKKLDGRSIDDYISLFESYVKQILNISYTKKQLVMQGSIPFLRKSKLWSDDKFDFRLPAFYPQKILVLDINKTEVGITEQSYRQIDQIAKKIFMLEKYCSKTTKKFWQQGMVSSAEQIDFSKNYSMLVKVIFPGGWGGEQVNCNSQLLGLKRAQSTSLIDHKHPKNLFLYKDGIECACLVVEPSSQNMLCANKKDMWSLERIDFKNKYLRMDGKCHSDVSRVHEFDDEVGNHKIFAYGTQIATPKAIFGDGYNEVLMLDAKFIAVVSPNKNSNDYAKAVAEKLDLPFKTME